MIPCAVGLFLCTPNPLDPALSTTGEDEDALEGRSGSMAWRTAACRSLGMAAAFKALLVNKSPEVVPPPPISA